MADRIKMTIKFMILWASLPAVLYLATNGIRGTLSSERRPYVYFGSKTAYEFVRSKQFQQIPGCSPIKLWVLNRHGTRYPSKTQIKGIKTLELLRDQIIENHEKFRRGNLRGVDLQNLKKWSFNIDPNVSYDITPQGQQELRAHGYRMKSEQYPALFTGSLHKNIFFQTSTQRRSLDSAAAMAEGLYGATPGIHILPLVMNDTLLNNDECRAWEEKTADPEHMKEYTMFLEGKIIQDMLSNVSKRLGFLTDLKYEIVDYMYEACRHEQSWRINTESTFCSAFSEHDLKVNEYLEDLKFYYKYGYGNDLTRKIACPLVRDMLERFADVINNGNDSKNPQVTIYFGHSETILLLITALGINEDPYQLKHDTFKDTPNRQWRTSFMDPFSANIEAVLYKCQPDNSIKILFRSNEYVVKYPGCNNGLCPWSYIENKFKTFIDPKTCNLDFCHLPYGWKQQLLDYIQLQRIYDVLTKCKMQVSSIINPLFSFIN